MVKVKKEAKPNISKALKGKKKSESSNHKKELNAKNDVSNSKDNSVEIVQIKVSPLEKSIEKSFEKFVEKPVKLLIKAQGGECFFMSDGSVLSDLKELADALDKMSNDTFFSHVNDSRNDFSAWVKEILKEEELANLMLSQKSPERCQIVILRHLLK